MSGFDIGSRHVGDGSPCFIIAEVAQAHEGSVRIAHDFIDAIADAGADAVKFQCHIAEAESTPDEPWRKVPEYPQDANRFEYWKRMEFTEPQWYGLFDHANRRGLEFLCSPFSVEAVKLLNPLVPAWKVPSGETTNEALFKAIAQTGKPVLISTGLDYGCHSGNGWIAGGCEHDPPLWALGFNHVPHMWLACTSIYPTPPEKIDLEAAKRYRGISDHSGTIWPALAAVTLGAFVVEVHVKLSDYDQGFDASSSITIDQLADLVAGVRFIEKAKKPVDKDALAKELEPMRRLFMDRHKRRAALDAK